MKHVPLPVSTVVMNQPEPFFNLHPHHFSARWIGQKLMPLASPLFRGVS